LIDLPTALRLAEGANPRLGQSREAVREALAQYQGTRVLLLPNLNAGSNYHLHNGVLQTSFGLIRNLTEQSVYVGGGARTLAAETVAIPMVQIFAHLGEAIFLPLAARQEMSARSSESIATETLVLLDVVSAYLELAGNEARIEAWRQSEGEAGEIARMTEAFAVTGQGRDGDFKRARTDALLLRVERQGSEADANVASNQLARLLRLDPSTRLTTARAPIEIVVLVDPQTSAAALVELALMRRWELAARSAQISAANDRYRMERTRPLFPLISIGFSAGGFGGGSNQTSLGVPSFFQAFSGRDDFDVMALWSLQNMGFGNIALARQRRVDRDTLFNARVQTENQIRREVVSAHAAAIAARLHIDVADRQLVDALRGAEEEMIRTRAGQGLPIEALNSIKLLAEARQDAIDAVVNYNIAEFRLFAAVGEIPNVRTPDPIVPRAAGEAVPAPPPAGEAIPAPK
jgi:outer membrane protein TolC